MFLFRVSLYATFVLLVSKSYVITRQQLAYQSIQVNKLGVFIKRQRHYLSQRATRATTKPATLKQHETESLDVIPPQM